MADPTDLVRGELAALLPRLRRFARALAGDPTEGDDLVQAALERALKALDQWRPGTRLDSWIFRIMKNAWIDEIRARAARGKVLAPEDAGDEIAIDGAGAMETRLEARAVQRVVSTLPEEQRVAVALVLVEGLSYREAADTLEIPIGTLTSRLARGRAAIEWALGGAAP
jgi:RNA polymerase sigma-70 factor (ECF subfamily)